MTFAQLSTNVPWPVTSQWILGLLGFLTAVSLIFAIVIQAKKLFGRTPPFHEELDKREKAIRKQIYAVEHNLRREFMSLHQDQERRLAMLEEQHAELQRDRIRKWEELTRGLGDLGAAVAFIRGKIAGEEGDAT